MSYFKGQLVELLHNTPAWEHGDLVTDWQVTKVFDFDTCSDVGVTFKRAQNLTLYVPIKDIKDFCTTTTKVTRVFNTVTKTVDWVAND